MMITEDFQGHGDDVQLSGQAIRFSGDVEESRARLRATIDRHHTKHDIEPDERIKNPNAVR